MDSATNNVPAGTRAPLRLGAPPITCSQGLRLEAGPDEAACVWNVVAYEGEWKGHPAGPFAFTRATFEQIVTNFRAEAPYKRRAGLPAPDQASAEEVASGVYDVVQWDFHHAAEMPAAEVAMDGAPAQGWVLELKLGEHEGKSALLSLTRWLPRAKQYIRNGEYKYCSVSVWLDAIDPQSGKNLGAVLTSIAITNRPFLQDLPPLRASRDGRRVAAPWYYGSAADETTAFASIRSLYCMPETATITDVIARFALVKAWIGGGSLPPDLDDDAKATDVASALRQIVNLPLLTETTEVLTQVDAVLARLVAPPPAQLSAGGAGHQQENLMTTNATGAPSGAKDATVLPAAGAMLVAGPDLRVTLAKIIAKRRNCAVDDISDGHILAALEGAVDVQAKIDELMGALGAKTFADALAKMSAAEELKCKLQDALAGKKAAEDALSGYESDMVEEDVGMALASLGITDETKAGKVRKALLSERGATPESIAAFRKTYDLDALKKDARAKLVTAAQAILAERAGGPQQKPATAPSHLTASIVTVRQTPPATPQDGGLTLALAPDGKSVTLVGGPISREPAPGTSGTLTLAQLQDRYPSEPNDFLRKVAFIKAEHAKNNPNAPALDHLTACERAHGMRIAA